LKFGENVEFHRDCGRKNKVFRDAMCIVGVSAGHLALLSELAIGTAKFLLFAKIYLEKRRIDNRMKASYTATSWRGAESFFVNARVFGLNRRFCGVLECYFGVAPFGVFI